EPLLSKSGLNDPFDPVIPPEGRLLHLGGKVQAVAFSPDGAMLAAGVADRPDGATIWNLATGKVAHRLNWGDVQCLAFSQAQDKFWLLGAGGRGSNFWYSVTQRDGEAVTGWEPSWGTVRALAVKDDGTFAQAIGDTVHVYKLGGDNIGKFVTDAVA